MKIYIIHSPRDTKRYFDRIREAEKLLAEEGHLVLNPLPADVEVEDPDFGNPDFFRLHGNKLNYCEAVFAMKDWCKSDIGNLEMAMAMEQLKTITFEQENMYGVD